MQKFEYASPTTKEQAVALLGASWGETEVLAGGTDLLSLMKDHTVTPKRVVNIKSIKELDVIRTPRNGSAAKGVASPQIRNMGTVGGDLLQRPRCWYYRAGFGLFAKGENGEPLVPNGDNRYHAILGNDGEAKFVSPSSLAPALIALNAKVKVFGPSGEREVAADKFFVTPKSDSDREYDLRPNEILTWITIPPALGVRSATYEVRQREALDWPLAAASVALTLDAGKKVKAARIAMGHVAPTPWLAAEAAEYLTGKTIDEDVAAEAGRIAVAQAKPLGRNAYKVQLARVAVKRAILQAAG
jgi:xanthine dehydrogenase YagS FAD-binding subunit